MADQGDTAKPASTDIAVSRIVDRPPRREIGGMRYQLVDAESQIRVPPGVDTPVLEALSVLAVLGDGGRTMGRVLQAIESMAEGFILFDAEDRVVLVNTRYRDFYPALADLLVPGAKYSDIAAAARARASSMPVRLDGWVRDGGQEGQEIELPDGRWIRATERTVEGGGQVGIRTDITAMKQREAALRELERLKTEFVNNVSHELRTPLTSIHAALGLMAGGVAGELPPEAGEMVAVAHRNSERLLRLVNDLLDIGKIEARSMSFAVGPHNLMPLVRRALDEIAAFAEPYGIALRLDGADGAQAMLDPDRFIQALTNLLSNAIKFSPRGGEVTVTVTARPGYWRVSVIDRGQGIPPDKQEQVFERFFQVDGPQGRPRGGTGLGLAIVRSIMDNLGGTVGLESKPGQGTTFWLDLRAAQ